MCHCNVIHILFIYELLDIYLDFLVDDQYDCERITPSLIDGVTKLHGRWSFNHGPIQQAVASEGGTDDAKRRGDAFARAFRAHLARCSDRSSKMNLPAFYNPFLDVFCTGGYYDLSKIEYLALRGKIQMSTDKDALDFKDPTVHTVSKLAEGHNCRYQDSQQIGGTVPKHFGASDCKDSRALISKMLKLIIHSFAANIDAKWVWAVPSAIGTYPGDVPMYLWVPAAIPSEFSKKRKELWAANKDGN
eukprot:Gb_21457 [translate_table: standard]